MRKSKYLKKKLIQQRKKRKQKIQTFSNVIIFFTQTRNNIFVNILNFQGHPLLRSSCGHICYIKKLSRYGKKSKEVLSFLTILVCGFLKEHFVRRFAFIFNGRWRFFKVCLYRILRSKKKKKFRLIFLGRRLCLPFGGCRAGKRRNFRSNRKKRFHVKKYNWSKRRILQFRGLGALKKKKFKRLKVLRIKTKKKKNLIQGKSKSAVFGSSQFKRRSYRF